MKKQEQDTTAFDKRESAAQMRTSAQLARRLGHEEIAKGNESIADYIEELEQALRDKEAEITRLLPWAKANIKEIEKLEDERAEESEC